MATQPPIDELHFSNAPEITTAIPGPESEQLLDRQAAIDSNAVAYPKSVPIAIDAAKGATVRDVDGNTFIDFFAGIGVLNVGHSNPYVLDAVHDQLDAVAHTIDFPTEARLALIEALNEIVPPGLRDQNRVVFGGPTGSDAIEASIKLAKHHTGGDGMIAFRGSYHGATTGALSLTGARAFKEEYGPLLADVQFVSFPHPVQSPENSLDVDASAVCPVENGPCCTDLACAEALADVDELLGDPFSGLANPAGIWVEPVQGTGGIVYPPPGFLSGLRTLADRYEVPLIIDEIQTGFGRTGEWFASDLYDVTPDIMPVSKSISGSGLPLSATIYHEDYDTWGPGGHVGTYRGNAPGMIGGVRAIEYIQDQELLEHARELGHLIDDRLDSLADRHDRVVDVRGDGLYWAIEFSDTETSDASDVVAAAQTNAYKQGVLVWTAGRRGEVLRIMPPLVITESLLEEGVAILEAAIDAALD